MNAGVMEEHEDIFNVFVNRVQQIRNELNDYLKEFLSVMIHSPADVLPWLDKVRLCVHRLMQVFKSSLKGYPHPADLMLWHELISPELTDFLNQMDKWLYRIGFKDGLLVPTPNGSEEELCFRVCDRCPEVRGLLAREDFLGLLEMIDRTTRSECSPLEFVITIRAVRQVLREQIKNAFGSRPPNPGTSQRAGRLLKATLRSSLNAILWALRRQGISVSKMVGGALHDLIEELIKGISKAINYVLPS